MRISDWSSDVCSSDLTLVEIGTPEAAIVLGGDTSHQVPARSEVEALLQSRYDGENRGAGHPEPAIIIAWPRKVGVPCILCNERDVQFGLDRKSNTSELQSLMRISYAVFCLKKKTH